MWYSHMDREVTPVADKQKPSDLVKHLASPQERVKKTFTVLRMGNIIIESNRPKSNQDKPKRITVMSNP